RELTAKAGSGFAREFDIARSSFRNLRADELSLAMKSGGFLLSSPYAAADAFRTKDYELRKLAGRKLTVENRNGKTTVFAADLTSD
ncbi:hypothetical protein OFB80_31760, partial [Escherichia coli]|nr:hypothetical protein [Escherichia coli]